MSIDDLTMDSLEEAMLLARMRIQTGNPQYQLGKLDIAMYKAGEKARENAPPVIVPKYAHQIKLSTVYGKS